jgi:hypothetical protein
MIPARGAFTPPLTARVPAGFPFARILGARRGTFLNRRKTAFQSDRSRQREHALKREAARALSGGGYQKTARTVAARSKERGGFPRIGTFRTQRDCSRSRFRRIFERFFAENKETFRAAPLRNGGAGGKSTRFSAKIAKKASEMEILNRL